MELAPGEMLGPYRLVEPAGAGGMAEVWRAYQARLDRYVAVKVLPRHLASQPGYVERFEREARAISRLDHPNILTVHDFGEQDGFSYMVSPFVGGGTLTQRMGRPWPLDEVLRAIEPLASALDYAHRQGVVHRDVKPSNVLISEQGRLLLSDFGVARMLEPTAGLTRTGTVIGTPAYMSPEQADGRPAGPASDLYSLGIVLYELLTGRVPFQAETPMAVAFAHLYKPLPPPRTINSALSEAVEAVLFKALAKEPGERFPSGAALHRALAGAQRAAPSQAAAASGGLDAPATVALPRGDPLPSPPAVPKRRTWQPRLLASGILLAALAIFLVQRLIGFTLPLPSSPTAQTRATDQPAAAAQPLVGLTPSLSSPPTAQTQSATRPALVSQPLASPAASSQPSAWIVVAGDPTKSGDFVSLAGMAVDREGNLYGTDRLLSRIVKLSPSGQPLARWGTRGSAPGQFEYPEDVAVDGQGNVYVADVGNGRIQKLSPDGQPLAQWGTPGSAPGQFSSAVGMAIDRQGNLYVADVGNHRVQKLSPDGQPLAQWGTQGSAPGQFLTPTGVALDGQGNLYVADMGNHRVQKLSPDGQPFAQWGTPGSAPGQFVHPTSVAVDGQGTIYIADSGNNRIQKLSPDGRPLAQWGTPGSAPGQFKSPRSVAVDGQGTIYVAETDNPRIQKLPPGRGGE